CVRGWGGMETSCGAKGYLGFRDSFFETLTWAALAALLVALLASYIVSRYLTAPLHAMKNASQRIAEGHYNERVPVHEHDELGQLAISFNTMAERLEQVEAMRRRLIGDVAHELRTPLTAIKGSMEGLIDGILPATPETFEQVAAEADRLSRLVDDLQELSRVESGAFTLDLAPVSLLDLIETARKRTAASYAAKGVALIFDVPTTLPAVRADADRLLQVLLNLLNNALQYTPSGGRVTLSASVGRNEVVLRLADTGIGIPAEHLPYIFDRFYRVDRSRSRQSGGGSGIGLTICKHLVEAHGGRIWAESPGEGQGSIFTFTIPVM
ncbi:MAG: HAMP domain-containing sensor histidine kinase, partial [Anaerolineales bacterium]|nr:HAMP domain-containing sensor histidine kinase [Anaerolineales bacterium]